MLKQKFYFILLSLIWMTQCKAQSISYSYDSSGNRIVREIIYSQVNRRETDKTTDYIDKLQGHDIKISPNPIRGQLTVWVEGLTDSDKCQFHLYGISGLLRMSSTITKETTSFDMSLIERGNYILLITFNGKQSTWKLIVE